MLEERQSPARQPAFSGSFYPADPAALRRVVTQYLAGHPEPIGETPRILIVPHAGYVYSGKVAGAGFRQVQGCSRVILLGVSHQGYFDKVAAYEGTSWQTPLGYAAVDTDMVRALVASNRAFYVDNNAHQGEHGLEVQVPFLQHVLSDFRIVPLLLGGHYAIRETSAVLADFLDDQTLLVISSDLSHYPSQTDAERVDRGTIDAILSADPETFQGVIAAQMHQNVPGLLTCACGAAAIEVALHVAQMLHLDTAHLLAYQNSGHVGGDTRSVVGYASIAFS